MKAKVLGHKRDIQGLVVYDSRRRGYCAECGGKTLWFDGSILSEVMAEDVPVKVCDCCQTVYRKGSHAR